jgi:hypothetical protein
MFRPAPFLDHMRAATRILVVASFLILSATSLRPGFEPWIYSLNTQFL